MKQIELIIQNRTGLHARPAKVLVNLAKRFKAEITIQHGEKKANAKSMVSVLTLGASSGSRILLQTSGEDEDAALREIKAAILAGLGDGDPQAGPAPTAPPVPIPAEPLSAPRQTSSNGAFRGVGAAPGIAVGRIYHIRQDGEEMDRLVARSAPVKLSMPEALGAACKELAQISRQMAAKNMTAEAAIFEAHIELLQDPDLAAGVEARLNAGCGPLQAWKSAVDERAAAIAAINDPLLAARADDMLDAGRRVLRLMLGVTEKTALPSSPVIVVARDLSPSDTAAFDPERVLGFGVVNGGPTSHIAILARAMSLPAVVGMDEAVLGLAEQTPVILNGNDGTIVPDPSPDLLAEAAQSQQRWIERRKAAQEMAAQPAITLDGARIDVTANAGSPADAAKAVKMGADGIGLLRTEFLFLERETAPDEEEQFQVYRAIVETMAPSPVIIRTLDIGGDKPLPYIQLKPEMNPFLGERGIRLCLNRPELFREQLRAILRSAAFGKPRIMFPMVSDIAELCAARSLVEEIRQELGVPPVPIGIMIEVPSAALLAEKFAPEIDFFSIGTNDLTQYTLAVDRAHPALASRHDGLHPAVLRLIAQTIEGAHRYGKRADLCGELGSDPAAVPILLGLGIDELSVSIPAVPTVKAQVRSLNMADLKLLAARALECSTAQEVRELARQLSGA